MVCVGSRHLARVEALVRAGLGRRGGGLGGNGCLLVPIVGTASLKVREQRAILRLQDCGGMGALFVKSGRDGGQVAQGALLGFYHQLHARDLLHGGLFAHVERALEPASNLTDGAYRRRRGGCLGPIRQDGPHQAQSADGIRHGFKPVGILVHEIRVHPQLGAANSDKTLLGFKDFHPNPLDTGLRHRHPAHAEHALGIGGDHRRSGRSVLGSLTAEELRHHVLQNLPFHGGPLKIPTFVRAGGEQGHHEVCQQQGDHDHAAGNKDEQVSVGEGNAAQVIRQRKDYRQRNRALGSGQGGDQGVYCGGGGYGREDGRLGVSGGRVGRGRGSVGRGGLRACGAGRFARLRQSGVLGVRPGEPEMVHPQDPQVANPHHKHSDQQHQQRNQPRIGHASLVPGRQQDVGELHAQQHKHHAVDQENQDFPHTRGGDFHAAFLGRHFTGNRVEGDARCHHGQDAGDADGFGGQKGHEGEQHLDKHVESTGLKASVSDELGAAHNQASEHQAHGDAAKEVHEEATQGIRQAECAGGCGGDGKLEGDNTGCIVDQGLTREDGLLPLGKFHVLAQRHNRHGVSGAKGGTKSEGGGQGDGRHDQVEGESHRQARGHHQANCQRQD